MGDAHCVFVGVEVAGWEAGLEAGQTLVGLGRCGIRHTGNRGMAVVCLRQAYSCRVCPVAAGFPGAGSAKHLPLVGLGSDCCRNGAWIGRTRICRTA